MSQDDVAALVRIGREHPTANKVRHAFMKLSGEEAVAASFNLPGFCQAFGITHPLLDTPSQTLKIWEEKVSPLEQNKELPKLKFHAGPVAAPVVPLQTR